MRILILKLEIIIYEARQSAMKFDLQSDGEILAQNSLILTGFLTVILTMISPGYTRAFGSVGRLNQPDVARMISRTL